MSETQRPPDARTVNPGQSVGYHAVGPREQSGLATARPFQPGDVVRLRSGGPAMTVEKLRTDAAGVAGADAECVWIADKGAERVRVAVMALETVGDSERKRFVGVTINNHAARPDGESVVMNVLRQNRTALAAPAAPAFRFTIDVAPDPEHPRTWVATCQELGAASVMSAARTPHDALVAIAGAVRCVVSGILEVRGTPDSGLEVLREIAAGYAAQRRAAGSDSERIAPPSTSPPSPTAPAIDEFRAALRRLLGGSPLGYHEGKLITARRSSDADIVAWLQELWAFVEGDAVPPTPERP